MSENKGPWKDSDHPILAFLALSGVVFLWGCVAAVFLGLGYVALKICGPIFLFLATLLGGCLTGLITRGSP
jgi:hypothetical protein